MRDISQFTHGSYDLLVVGGGINGAAIAHMAALNGLKVALLEKGDFASGTSSKSTKLIHGGLRYLETFDFDLVREALRERFFLLRDAPHLVHPISFIIPVYNSDKRPLWLMRLGVALYDYLAGKKKIGRHRFVQAKEVVQSIPSLKTEGLLGGVLYYDAQMDDARLVLENVLSAQAQGAHAANYVKVNTYIKKDGKAIGVRARDILTGKEFDVYAKRIICAVGAWTNVVSQKNEDNFSHQNCNFGRIRTTKGVHVVCPGTISNHALLIPTAQDKRVIFVIPWMGNSLIGTTDTDYEASADEVTASQKDIDYLFKELQRVLPFSEKMFKKEEIITTFAGLRSLVYKKGDPSKISRDHVVTEAHSGVVYVAGGKYTTYRKIAEDGLRVMFPSLRLVDTRKGFPVFGSGRIIENAKEAGLLYGLNEKTARHLMDVYGTRYGEVALLAQRNPVFSEPLCSCSLTIKAQVVYAIEKEMAVKEEDIIDRRLSLVYRGCRSGQCIQEIRRLVGRV